MQVNVKFDTSALDKRAERYQKNLSYSTAQAINDAVLEAQKRIRQSLRTTFHLRKVDFMNRSIKIFAFAKVSANRVYAEIGIDNKARLMLSLYESGGARLPFKGRNIAVPIIGQAARPTAADAVRTDMTFQSLNFHKGPITRAGKTILSGRRAQGNRKRKLGGGYYVWQGNNRTFILPHTARAPLGGVFQRVGPGRGDIRMIYSFKQHIQLRAVLRFVQHSQQTFDEVFSVAFKQRFSKP